VVYLEKRKRNGMKKCVFYVI